MKRSQCWLDGNNNLDGSQEKQENRNSGVLASCQGQCLELVIQHRPKTVAQGQDENSLLSQHELVCPQFASPVEGFTTGKNGYEAKINT